MGSRLCIGLALMIRCNILAAQEAPAEIIRDTSEVKPVEIDERAVEQFKNNPDFDYDVERSTAPEWWISFKNWLESIATEFFEWLFGVEKAAGALSVFLEILPYILLVILLFILIKFFLSVNARSIMHAKQNQSIVALSEEEHIIKNEDIQQLIAGALEQKDYRLAVRYYYLFMLQLMSEKELIVWELQKTNEDYTQELKREDLVTPFALSTRLYNYFWYGEFPINEEKYKKVELQFTTLKQLLTNG